MLETLLDLVARLGGWSYLIIMLAAALECAAFVGLVVPGDERPAGLRLFRPRRHPVPGSPKAVFIGRFVGFARALVPFVAGAARMPLGRFVIYDALGAAIWTVARRRRAISSAPAGGRGRAVDRVGWPRGGRGRAARVPGCLAPSSGSCGWSRDGIIPHLSRAIHG